LIPAFTRGWFSTVVAALGQPWLHVLHAREQRSHLLALALMLGLKFGKALDWGHASRYARAVSPAGPLLNARSVNAR
jgi:hypothetical protein